MGFGYGLVLTQRKENVMNHNALGALQTVAQYLLDNHVDELKEYGFWTCLELAKRVIKTNRLRIPDRAIDLMLDRLRKEFMDKHMSGMDLSVILFITQYVEIVTDSNPDTPTYQQKLQETRIEWLQFIINYRE